MTKTCAVRGEHSQPLLDVRHVKQKVFELKHSNIEGQVHKEQTAEKMQCNLT